MDCAITIISIVMKMFAGANMNMKKKLVRNRIGKRGKSKGSNILMFEDATKEECNKCGEWYSRALPKCPRCGEQTPYVKHNYGRF